jgi:hypothetical protein
MVCVVILRRQRGRGRQSQGHLISDGPGHSLGSEDRELLFDLLNLLKRLWDIFRGEERRRGERG